MRSNLKPIFAAAALLGLAANAFGAAFPGDSTGFSGLIGAAPNSTFSQYYIPPATQAPPPPACTWQNETGSRLLQKASWMRCQFRRGCSYGPPVGPTYTNTTGKTIYVQVAYGYPLTEYLNGTPVASGETINFSVAPGDTYSVYEDNINTYSPWVPNPQAASWLECR